MKVLFYSNNCNFCLEIIKKLELSPLKDEIKSVCIDNNNSFNINVVPTIIDSDYKDVLKGKKAFEYLKNKEYFDNPTNNVLTWKDKGLPDPKIEKDKMANDENKDDLFSKSDIINEERETDKSNSLQSNQDKELFKNAKLNRRSALLLRRR